MRFKDIINESIIDTPKFKKWFGKSKITTNSNKPMIAVHTSMTKWTQVDMSKLRSSAVWGKGIYLSLSGKGSWKPVGNNITMELYVKSENPLDITKPLDEKSTKRLEKLIGRKLETVPLITLENRYGSVIEGAKKAGFDSIIHDGPGSTGKHIVVFEPTQIKSATENNGNFDPNNKDITK